MKIQTFRIVVLVTGMFFQQTVFAEACPFTAEVCQEISDLAENIKNNSTYSGSSTGFNIVESKECCIKTYGIDGIDKVHFDVGEMIFFGMQEGTVAQWGVGSTPEQLNYTIGFSTEGTYLDDSCHAKLGFQTYPIAPYPVLWYWVDQDANCNNAQQYVDGQLYSFGAYAYSTPGLKVITSIALPYYYTTTAWNVPMTFKIVAVGDEYRPDYSWLIPVLSLLL